MIMHGGDDGELFEYGHSSSHVFDWTKEQLQTLDIGQGERMPTLEDLLKLLEGRKRMLINIELKAPVNAEVGARYNHRLAAQTVVNLISKYGIAHQTMISSFNPKVIDAVHTASEGRRNFVV